MLLTALLFLLAQTPAVTEAATAAKEAAEAAQKAAEAAQKAAAAAAALAGPLPAVPAAVAPAPAAPPPVMWTGTVTLGLIALTGNSQTLTFSAGGAFERKSAEWIWGVKAYSAYGQSTITIDTAQVNQVTALNAGVQARGDRRFSDQVSLYVMAGIDTDHLKSVEDRPFGELGLSFIAFDTKEGDLAKSTLKVDLGFRYGREYRFAYYPAPGDPRMELPEVDVVAPRLGVSFRYAINKDVIFTEEVSALGNVVGQARLLFSSTSKLTARLTDKVSLGVGFVVNDDTVPAPGKVSGDTATTIGLEIGI